MNKFFKEIEKISEEARESILGAITDQEHGVLSVEINIKLSDESVSKFELNDDIMITQLCTPGEVKTKYYYKGIDVNPDCYYLRPDDYHSVSTLRILQECIAQDTPRPDIKYLERGEDKMPQD